MESRKSLPELTFVKPALKYEAAFQDWLKDWRSDAYDPYRWIFTRAWNDFRWYVDLCNQLRFSGHPPELTVPLDASWAFVGDRLVGELYVFYAPMHDDNHIGYKVRPSERRRGIATVLLKHGIDLLRARNIREARLTCNDGNMASAAVIERCGGRRISDKQAPDGHMIRRYVIDI